MLKNMAWGVHTNYKGKFLFEIVCDIQFFVEATPEPTHFLAIGVSPDLGYEGSGTK